MRALTAWVVVAVTLTGTPADAFTFKFEDGGAVHYTNAPSDPRYQRLLGWPEARPSPPSPPPRAGGYSEQIAAVAARHGVDPRLVEAVVRVESGGNPGAVSPKGARGLMQLMPAKSAELGVQNPFEPRQNLEGGVRHLRDLLQRYDGDLRLALAAYNAGEEAVRAHRGVPPYRETREYVRKVLELYQPPEAPSTPAPATPQRVYRVETDGGTVIYTNLPPPAPAKTRF